MDGFRAAPLPPQQRFGIDVYNLLNEARDWAKGRRTGAQTLLGPAAEAFLGPVLETARRAAEGEQGVYYNANSENPLDWRIKPEPALELAELATIVSPGAKPAMRAGKAVTELPGELARNFEQATVAGLPQVVVKGKKLNRDQEVQYHREAAQEFRNEFGAPELPTLIAPNYGQALRENRAFKRREMASGAGTAPAVVTAHHGRPPQPEYRPTTDDVLVPVLGDPTRTGETVREVGGVELPVPVDLQGGPLHAQQWGNWSSMRSAAGSKQANVRVAVGRTGGKNPVLVYTTMDQASPNFSTMPVEVALQQMDVLSPSKETIRKFNARIRKDKRGKGFVGIDTKEGREQLMREGSGNLRKAVMETMALKEFQYQGMPDVELIRDAIIEPALRHVPPGQSGFTMMRGLPDLDVYPDDYHRTYNTHIPGRYLGTTSVVPYEDMFPDVAAQIKNMDRAYELGSLRQRHHYQPVTDELLERLYGGK